VVVLVVHVDQSRPNFEYSEIFDDDEPSTLEIDVYVRRYAVLVVLARNDDDDGTGTWTCTRVCVCVNAGYVPQPF